MHSSSFNDSTANGEAKSAEAREVELRGLLTQDPANPVLLGELAEIYTKQGRNYAARQLLQQSTTAAPLSAPLRVQYAESLAAAAYSRPALRQLEQSLRLEKSGRAYALQGRLYWEFGRRRLAIDAWEAGWKAQPPSIESGLALARLDLERGQYASAAERCRIATAAEPDNFKARELLAEALVGQNDVPGAIDQLERVASRSKSNAATFLHLATLQRKKGDIAAAEENLVAGRKIAPDHPLLGQVERLLREPGDPALVASPYRPLPGSGRSQKGDE
jgi:predicted Zn-dependent protease